MNSQALTFLPMLVILGVFMYFASRRQKRAMQATIDLHESLRVGDHVQTTSGMHASITRIADETVDLEIAPGVVTTWVKMAIASRVEPEVVDAEAEEIGDLADDAGRLPND